MSKSEIAAWALAVVFAALAYFFRPKPPNSPVEARHEPKPIDPLPAPDQRLREPPTPPRLPPPGTRVVGGLGRDHAKEYVRSVRDDL